MNSNAWIFSQTSVVKSVALDTILKSQMRWQGCDDKHAQKSTHSDDSLLSVELVEILCSLQIKSKVRRCILWAARHFETNKIYLYLIRWWHNMYSTTMLGATAVAAASDSEKWLARFLVLHKIVYWMLHANGVTWLQIVPTSPVCVVTKLLKTGRIVPCWIDGER